jgi:dCMP deaminase
VLLLGASFAQDYPVLAKEIRALAPDVAAGYLRRRGDLAGVRVIEHTDLPRVIVAQVLVAPDEELMRTLVAAHELAAGRTVVFERTFLRWDRSWSLAQRPAEFDGPASTGEVELLLSAQALARAQLSSDWWRQVGALAARDGQVLAVAHNEHLPTEYRPYLDGDPRNDFSRGIHIELSTAIHAEAAIVARAAREGMSLAGADLYVSTFPCPACARLVAQAGFARVYFAGPYATLDGDQVLRAAGVRLFWVDLTGGVGA